MLIKTFVLLSIFAAVAAFGPARMQVRMSSASVSAKVTIAGVLAGSAFSGAAFAVEGASPKQGFFDNRSTSSPFTNENREDAMFSPYSPYGNGDAAVYNGVRGQKQEISFWQNQFNNCVKRTQNVPKFAKKKNWASLRTELTSTWI